MAKTKTRTRKDKRDPLPTFRNEQSYEFKTKTLYENSQISLSGVKSPGTAAATYVKSALGVTLGDMVAIESQFASKMAEQLEVYVPLDVVHRMCSMKNLVVSDDHTVTFDLHDMQIVTAGSKEKPLKAYSQMQNKWIDVGTDITTQLLTTSVTGITENIRKKRFIKVPMKFEMFDNYADWKKKIVQDGNIVFVHSVKQTTSSLWVKYAVIEKTVISPYVKYIKAQENLAKGMDPMKGPEKIREYVNSVQFIKDMNVVYGKHVDIKKLPKLSKAQEAKMVELQKKTAEQIIKNMENSQAAERVAEGIPVDRTAYGYADNLPPAGSDSDSDPEVVIDRIAEKASGIYPGEFGPTRISKSTVQRVIEGLPVE